MHLMNSIRIANHLLRLQAIDLKYKSKFFVCFFQQTNCFLTLVRHKIIMVHNQFVIKTKFTSIYVLNRLHVNEGSKCWLHFLFFLKSEKCLCD